MNARFTMHALANKFYSGTPMTNEDVETARQAIQTFANTDNIALYSLIKKQVDERVEVVAEDIDEVPESTD